MALPRSNDGQAVAMSIEQRRAMLAPGEVADGIIGNIRIRIVGQAADDGSTRQQRRAAARARAKV